MPKNSLRAVFLVAALAATTSLTVTAQDFVAGPAAPVVPHLVKYSGSLPDAPAAASVVEVKFAMYVAQTGGGPLWSETQQVALDPLGHYAVLLGATSPAGLPDALFAAGAAKWLGVTLSGGTEAPRTLLSANAYALKASDAETLAGHPLSDFKLARNSKSKPDATGITTIDAGTGVIVTNPTGPTTTIGLSSNYLATLGNTYYAQLATANKFTGNQSISGNLLSSGTLTTLSGANKLKAGGAVDITYAGGVYTISLDPTQGKAFGNTYWAQLAAANTFTGINTFAMPITFAASQAFPGTATLAGTNAFTGNNSFSNAVTFASAQTFPGTLTKVSASSPLTASTTSGAVTLGLNETTLKTSLNSVYAQLGAGDVFADYIQADQAAGPGHAAVLGFGTSGSVGAYGDSDTGYGVQGESTSGQGVLGYVFSPAPGSEGVLGYTGAAFSTTYSEEATIANAGVWADTSSSGTGAPVGFFATADDGYAGAMISNGVDFPALFVDNNGGVGADIEALADGLDASSVSGSGVVGTAEGPGNGVVGIVDVPSEQLAGVKGVAEVTSNTGSLYNIYGAVWGDTGVSSTAIAPEWAIGVLGTADDSHAGVFLNNSTNGWSTMYVANYGTGGTGLVTPALFDTIMAVDKNGTCGVGNGSLSCTGQIKSLVSAGGSRTVETYAMQSPENWMEDFGAGSLAHGKAVIHLDPAFAETISHDGNYHVFITPNGDSKGLYVSAKSASSFEVRESGGGTLSLSFDYRIVAKRLGYEAQRLTDVTDSLARETARETMARGTGVKKAAAVRKVSPLEQALKTPHRRIVPSPSPRKQIPARPVAASAHEVASR